MHVIALPSRETNYVQQELNGCSYTFSPDRFHDMDSKSAALAYWDENIWSPSVAWYFWSFGDRGISEHVFRK